MKSFIKFLVSLFRNLFSQSVVAPDNTESVSRVTYNEIMSEAKKIEDSKKLPVVSQRLSLSSIAGFVTLPEVPARVVGKHRVVCRDEYLRGSYKVLGQIRSGGVARVRHFGDSSAPVQMVRLKLAA